jgi:uncharacterized protein YbjT (DUF2867 family)
VIHSDIFTDVPHFTGKYAVERMIEDFDLPVTILRPSYFIQNDTSLKDVLLGQGIYPQPIGSKGVSMVDARDVGEAAALFLLKRENAAEPLPRETIELVGPDLSPAKRSPASGPRCWAGKSATEATIWQRLRRSRSDPLRHAGWPATCGSR